MQDARRLFSSVWVFGFVGDIGFGLVCLVFGVCVFFFFGFCFFFGCVCVFFFFLSVLWFFLLSYCSLACLFPLTIDAATVAMAWMFPACMPADMEGEWKSALAHLRASVLLVGPFGPPAGMGRRPCDIGLPG